MIESIKRNQLYEKENYFLPDGNVLKLGEERISPPEILYNPELNGMEFPSFQNMILNSINKADMELRPKLYEAILLSGGNTAIKGTANKVYSEFKKLINQNMKIKIHSPKNPNLLCWIGGNIISGLDKATSGSCTFDKENPIISYMLQSDALLPWLNVLDNACL